jgi:CHC2 zinc finger
MRKNVPVDYRYLKTCVSIMMILDHYGWVRELKGSANVVRSRCPIHDGSNDKQFTINIKNNTWFCFGDCRRGGSILELVSALENIEIHEAAVRIASWYSLLPPHGTQQWSNVVSENHRPTHKAFTVEDRGEGEDADAFWTRVGSAWPHKDGKGFNIVLSALPVNGRVVLREFTDEEAKAEEEKKPKRAAGGKR